MKRRTPSAPAVERCGGCDRVPRSLAVLGIFFPTTGGAPVVYFLCSDCAAESSRRPAAVAQRVEDNLTARILLGGSA